MNIQQQQICTELWYKHEPQLRKACSYKLKKYPCDVDDVISEVFLALCQKILKDGEPNNPESWLYATMNNLAAIKFKQIYKEREKEISIHDNDVDLPYDSNFENTVHDNILIGDFFKSFQMKLNEQENRLIQYIYSDELSMKEIAEIKQSTANAIKQQHYRLMKKIKRFSQSDDQCFRRA